MEEVRGLRGVVGRGMAGETGRKPRRGVNGWIINACRRDLTRVAYKCGRNASGDARVPDEGKKESDICA